MFVITFSGGNFHCANIYTFCTFEIIPNSTHPYSTHLQSNWSLLQLVPLFNYYLYYKIELIRSLLQIKKNLFEKIPSGIFPGSKYPNFIFPIYISATTFKGSLILKGNGPGGRGWRHLDREINTGMGGGGSSRYL